MKNKTAHTQQLKLWLLLPFIFCAIWSLAPTNRTSEPVLFSKLQISVLFAFADNSIPFKNTFPEDSSSQNHLLSNSDVEEIVEPFPVKHFTIISSCSYNDDKLIIRKCQEASNIQFYLDIVPPPPKC